MNEPLLTTITIYWDRPDILPIWLKAVKGATIPEVRHILFLASYKTLDEERGWLDVIHSDLPLDTSIGHYHNDGAKFAKTPWIMKLDIDTLPNVRFFKELVPLLEGAKDREWFNAGMLYLSKASSIFNLNKSRLPLGEAEYLRILNSSRAHCAPGYHKPAGTNFICRRKDYLDLGGCHEDFRGYGWEDYQQIYMLESHRLRSEWKVALPGDTPLATITQRCRDEISRPKALELFERNKWLCLFHYWHSPGFRNKEQMERNRALLYSCIRLGR